MRHTRPVWVIDIPTTALAEEVERLLSGPLANDYYLKSLVYDIRLPDGIISRATFLVRANDK
jgi:hypothetical protein